MHHRVWVVCALGVTACSDGSSAIDAAVVDTAVIDTAVIDTPAIDGPGDASGTVDAVPGIDSGVPGGRHTFVVSRLRAPSTATEAQQFGLDIDDRANDGIDNQLGQLLAAYDALVPGFDASTGLADAVDRGLSISLISVRADSLVAQTGAYVFVHSGRDPQPPACNGPGDVVCRHHLTGTGAFTIATPGDGMIGPIAASRLSAGPGDFPLPFRFGASAVVEVPIVHGRVELRFSGDTIATGSKLGGGIRQTDFDSLVVPAIHADVTATVDADCPPPRTPPTCGCQASSAGQTALGLFDTNDDCTASLAEVRTTIDSLLTPDLDLTGDGVNDAISIGLAVEGVGATFGGP